MHSKKNQINIFSNQKQKSSDLNNEETLFRKGESLLNIGRLEQATEIFEKLIKLNDRNFNATHALANIAGTSGNWVKAMNYFQILINLNNSIPSIHNNYGIVLKNLGFKKEALKSYDFAISLKQDFIEAIYNRGIILNELKNFKEATDCFDKVIKLNPNYSEAYNNCGIAHKEINNYNQAIVYYQRAIELNPLNSQAYYNIGIVYSELQNYITAIKYFEKAIEIKPHFIEALFNQGQALFSLYQYEDALVIFKKALVIKPDYDNLFGAYIHTQMNMCDWNKFNDGVNNLISKIKKNIVIEPFPLLAITDSLSAQLDNTSFSLNTKYPLIQPNNIIKYKRKEKIRIAYISADFREHPVAFLVAEMLEKHDRNIFEIYGFYSGPTDQSMMHLRISSCFDQFINIHRKSDTEVANLFEEMEIDIAIDLTGATRGERIGIFSHRVAPVQLSYIGYLGTLGTNYYDYLIADKTIIPTEYQQYYSEKIVYLPSYQVNDSKRVISKKIFSKSELNLPESDFVYCCFNNNYKITPTTFSGWMRILIAVPDSVLFLYSGNKWAEKNLKREAEICGVNSARLVFGGHLERSDYLARYRSADLFLDTFPYNAGTTASDALWAGLPVLTLMGESFASRVAGSILNAIDLPELIAYTQTQYEEIAIELARQPELLKKIKNKIVTNQYNTLLFNATKFTNKIESAYMQMYERYHNELPPDNIYVN